MANSQGTWRDGPELPNQFAGPDEISDYPGQRLGLPEVGAGSQASVARRMGAVTIDWLMCWAIAGFTQFFTHSLGDTATLAYLLWIALGIICGWLFASTPGMMALGMGVARLDKPGEKVGLWRAAVRTIMTAFVLPAALVDTDGRGLHDRATGTSVIRA